MSGKKLKFEENARVTRSRSAKTPAPIFKGQAHLKLLAAVNKDQYAEDVEIIREVVVDVPWDRKHHPKTLDGLFLNKKKVEEVQSWVLAALEAIKEKDGFSKTVISKMCILSGPSGSGKTAAIMTLAAHHKIEVKEWINPTSLTDFNAHKVFTYGDEVTGQSQTDLFVNFIFRSAQYGTLPIKGRVASACNKRITVIEDFPNVFYRDNLSFHNVLRNFSSTFTSPMVFIVADTASSDSNLNKLFPKHIREELNINLITFNAIAPTYMSKFLTTICERESIAMSKQSLDEIAAVSGGDIRCAINSLQFRHQKTTVGKSRKAKPTFKRPLAVPLRKQNQMASAKLKDESLFLFHALGKVLYAKRKTNEESRVEHELVERLKNERRKWVLQNNPEELSNMIEVPPETFIYFLHQNFPEFYKSVDDCATASSHMADAEIILSDWAFDTMGVDRSLKSRESKHETALSVAIRGLMHSNTGIVSQSWKPLRKPICGDLQSRMQISVELCQSPFTGEQACLQRSFYTDIYPYFAKINSSMLSNDHKQHMQKIMLATSKGSFRNKFDDTNLYGVNTDSESNEGDELVNWTYKKPLEDEKCVQQPDYSDDPVEFTIEDFDD